MASIFPPYIPFRTKKGGAVAPLSCTFPPDFKKNYFASLICCAYQQASLRCPAEDKTIFLEIFLMQYDNLIYTKYYLLM